jgi:hypothetical protein
VPIGLDAGGSARWPAGLGERLCVAGGNPSS